LWQNKSGHAMNSHNHHMMGSVDAWFYEALAGINQDPDSPGYHHFRVEPQVVPSLSWASATVGTMRGDIQSSWSQSPSGLTLEVEVPVNSSASVSIPKNLEMTE